MTIQPFFALRIAVARRCTTLALILGAGAVAGAVRADEPVNDFPTSARVEYVNECINANGGTLAALYQCSCALDRIAQKLKYDEFVASGTFSRYSTLPGEGGGIFRDSGEAKQRAKLYRELESEAHRSCGLEH